MKGGVHWVLDLDGVCLLGTKPIPGGPEAVGEALARGDEVTYMTNNAMRGVAEFAVVLRRAGYPVSDGSVLTSQSAALAVLRDLVPPRGRVLVVGEKALRTAVDGVGFVVVDRPPAAGVVVANTRNFTYEVLDRASKAVRDGAVFVATNTDATLVSSGGEHPGAGSIVAAISVAGGRRPIVAGKPERPMAALVRARSRGLRTVFVGDRAETDVAFARRRRWRSVLVLTGVTTLDRLASIKPFPDVVARDLAEAMAWGAPTPLEVGAQVTRAQAGVRVWEARMEAGRVRVAGKGPGRALVAAAGWAAAGRPPGWRFPPDLAAMLRSGPD